MSGNTEIAVFGGGCFWCTEAIFRELRGIISAMPGYAGGHVEHPTYEQVSSGTTGHAEVTRIVFDPALISYDELLTVFFGTHDPTTPNRQGNDVGAQYRSLILYTNDEQKRSAEAFIKKLNASAASGSPVVTGLAPLGDFYEAEDYHRRYFERHKSDPYCQVVIAPKVQKVQHEFAALLKSHQE